MSDQVGRLRQGKLVAIVRDQLGVDAGEPGPFPGGATLLDGTRAWVLVDDEIGPRSIGGPLLWAARHGVTDLTVILGAGEPTLLGALARRASHFDPPPVVLQLHDRAVRSVAAAPTPAPAPPPPGADEFIDVLVDAGVDVVVEHGIVRGEVLGLEVARIARSEPGDPLRLEVGVGKFDRVTAAMMYADLPTPDALATVVAEVRRHRFPGAPPHPVRDLCRERWVRHDVLASVELVGALELEPAESTVDRDSLREVHPAIAVGRGEGGPLVVACTHGVDVDLLSMAADARAEHSPDAALVVASTSELPAPVHALGERLPGGVRFVEVPVPWA